MCLLLRASRTIVLGFIFASCAASVSASSEQRPWTVQDSVAVRYFVTNQRAAGTWSADEGEPLVFSRDGEYFFFVTYHGDLHCDCNQYQLHVYSVRHIQQALSQSISKPVDVPRPFQTVTMRSNSNKPAISRARWSRDNAAVLFFGVSDDGIPQLHRLHAKTGLLERLTEADHEISKFDIRGDKILYVVEQQEPSKANDKYPALPITSFIKDLVSNTEYAPKLYLSSSRHNSTLIASWSEGHAFGPWIAPNGRHAIVVLPPEAPSRIPREWREYDGRTLHDHHTKQDLVPSEFPSFVLIDLESGRSRPLLDAPAGWAVQMGEFDYYNNKAPQPPFPEALWFPNSDRVVLINTSLPLAVNQPERSSTAYLVEYELASGKWRILEPLVTRASGSPSAVSKHVHKVGWIKPGKELLVTHQDHNGKEVAGTVYSRRGDWLAGKSVASSLELQSDVDLLPDTLTVSVRQSANDPPVVVASAHRAELALTAPDPALRDIWRAPAKSIQWRDPDGTRAEGLLMMPKKTSGALRPPLVIQSYYYQPNLFLPDGVFPSSYAAQALVAQGMAVLQIANSKKGIVGTMQEGPFFVDRIDAAVKSLSDEGLIDPERVGLIGFSRGGYLTYYAITHPKRVRLAAAISADGWQGSYSSYLRDATLMSPDVVRTGYEPMFGNKPFWQNRSDWLVHETTFNVDRVRTPILFTVHGERVAELYAETLGAFRLNGRPMELLSFPFGEHQLVRPREREASLEASVAWMTFWLQEREDYVSEDVDRLTRWRAMRSQQDAILGNGR